MILRGGAHSLIHEAITNDRIIILSHIAPIVKSLNKNYKNKTKRKLKITFISIQKPKISKFKKNK